MLLLVRKFFSYKLHKSLCFLHILQCYLPTLAQYALESHRGTTCTLILFVICVSHDATQENG